MANAIGASRLGSKSRREDEASGRTGLLMIPFGGEDLKPESCICSGSCVLRSGIGSTFGLKRRGMVAEEVAIILRANSSLGGCLSRVNSSFTAALSLGESGGLEEEEGIGGLSPFGRGLVSLERNEHRYLLR